MNYESQPRTTRDTCQRYQLVNMYRWYQRQTARPEDLIIDCFDEALRVPTVAPDVPPSNQKQDMMLYAKERSLQAAAAVPTSAA